MLLKFGAVLSIICGFLMAIYTWTHLQQCIVVVRSSLRMLKLRKLAVHKLYLSRVGRTPCQGVLEHGLNLHWNIPLTFCENPFSTFCVILLTNQTTNPQTSYQMDMAEIISSSVEVINRLITAEPIIETSAIKVPFRYASCYEYVMGI